MGITTFEQVLTEDRQPQLPRCHLMVGRACYVRLSEMNRAKIQFISTHIASQYDALRLTILNRDEGAVDNLVLRFSDLFRKKHTSNPNFRNGIVPHLRDDYGNIAWYVYQPRLLGLSGTV